MVHLLATKHVPDTDIDRVETIKNIELGQRQAMDAAGSHRLTYQHRVEPAATPLAPGGDPEPFTTAADLLANFVEQFGRKRPLPDPGRIGLADAENIPDGARPEAGAGRRLRRHRVGGGN